MKRLHVTLIRNSLLNRVDGKIKMNGTAVKVKNYLEFKLKT